MLSTLSMMKTKSKSKSISKVQIRSHDVMWSVNART